ncbi:ubiquinone anaerobic biosynthesis accessory factor UbiT [Paraferrimonas haliotis]|uniref:Ubiquinone biosynthesis accessory factor UbiT n=1 Tax=Paraferrimonas haliotis TaxID=2013866 RepID=A0AA37TU12_9GAMM|nr:SCP2 sterol-binding domain-containing protein [Paraferrimonas haliotis]GLS82750.1 SCP-2 sterol transfer family protein [Paraferrimonas haliotis]
MSSLLSQRFAQQAVNAIPKIVTPPIQLVPFRFQARLIESMLSLVLKEQMDDDELEFIEGHWVGIKITDLSLAFDVSILDKQWQVRQHQSDVDVCFSADGQSLVLIAAMEEDPDTLFFQRKLCIEGDTELGLEVKNLLMEVEFDKMPAAVRHAISQLAGLIKAANQTP